MKVATTGYNKVKRTEYEFVVVALPGLQKKKEILEESSLLYIA